VVYRQQDPGQQQDRDTDGVGPRRPSNLCGVVQHYASTEITLKAAEAVYQTRLTGSVTDLRELMELAPQLPDPTYRNLLIDRACNGPGLPVELVAAARRVRAIGETA